MRIGIGYDIHELVKGRPLVLGGVRIDHDKGLKGHSDGDGLLHAIADAMLGALAAGDIGKHFPDTDPACKDMDSADILQRVADMARERNMRVVNIDANIIAQKPTMAPHIGAMRTRIAKIVGVPTERISVKARTNEELDAAGRGEAIITQAVVLLENIS